MTQRELEQMLEEEHQKQDTSHKQTVERHNEIMDLIEKAGEGLHGKRKRQTKALQKGA